MFRTVSLAIRLWRTPDDLAEEEGDGKFLLSASFNGENPTFTGLVEGQNVHDVQEFPFDLD